MVKGTVKQYQKDPLTQNKELLKNPSVQAMLRTIRYAEGTAGDRGYNTRVGNEYFEDLSKKPGKKVYIPSINNFSSAEGAYQFLNSTWEGVSKKLGLKDFSPESQDLAAIELIKSRGALPDVLNNNLNGALGKLAKEWASLPTTEGKSAYTNQKSEKRENLNNVFYSTDSTYEKSVAPYMHTSPLTYQEPQTQAVSYLADPTLFSNLAPTQEELPKGQESIRQGNTQEQDFMRDLLSQVGQGVAYVEPEKSPVFQDGGMTPKQFTLNYINSPKYKQRLQDSRYEDVNAEVKQRTLNSNPVVAPYKELSWFDKITGEESSERGSAYHPLYKTIQLDTPYDIATYRKTYPNATLPTKLEIEAHERSHASVGDFPESRLNVTDRRKLNNHHKKTAKSGHDTQPDENKADLDAFRYTLKQQGIYDAGTQDFNKGHLKKSKDSALKERLRSVYSDDSIIYLMNHVAETTTDDKEVPYAQNGGEVVKDNNGYWDSNNWGKVVKINSPHITMKGVNQNLLGISNLGERKIMLPGKDYHFIGAKTVTEVPLTKQEEEFLKDLYSTHEKS